MKQTKIVPLSGIILPSASLLLVNRHDIDRHDPIRGNVCPLRHRRNIAIVVGIVRKRAIKPNMASLVQLGLGWMIVAGGYLLVTCARILEISARPQWGFFVERNVLFASISDFVCCYRLIGLE